MEVPHKISLTSDEDTLDHAMRGFLFQTDTNFAQTSPVIDALSPDHHIAVIAKYKMTLAGVDIAYACVPLPEAGRPLEIITLVPGGADPKLFKISAQELLLGIDPMARQIELPAAAKSDAQQNLFAITPRAAIPRLRHFSL